MALEPFVGPPPEKLRPWWSPRSLIGAFTKSRYENDAHTRELVKLLVTAPPLTLALLLIGLGMWKVAGALDRLGARVDANGAIVASHSKALNDHLDEDLKNELADRVSQRILAADQKEREKKTREKLNRPVGSSVAPQIAPVKKEKPHGNP